MTDNKLTVNIGELTGGICASDIAPRSFIFRPQDSQEIMKLDKEGMVFMGERITDAGEAYEAWMKTMAIMQGKTAEDDDEPVAWAYITKDCKIVHYELVEGLVPLYRRPSLARKPLSDDEILRVATKSPPFIPWLLQEGVTLGDVRGMAVDFARRIEKAHGIGETE